MVQTPIKLIALDVDGTIMDKNFRISDRVKKSITLAVDKGVKVVIATGRMYSATVPVGVELGLKTPLAVYQGSMVREFYNSDRILLHHCLETELTLRLIRDLRKENIQINVYFDDKLYVEKESGSLKKYAEARKIPFYKVESFDDIENFRPTKVLTLDPDISKVDRVKDKFRKIYGSELNITKSTDYYCEFVNKNCSKAGAIAFLSDLWRVDRSEILAIGDHENDKEMLDYAEIGIAMGNGHEEFKRSADYVTDTVDNDGAAIAIEKFVL